MPGVTIVATPSAANANSYLTMEEAQAGLLGYVTFRRWDAADETTRKSFLLEAARRIDRYKDWGPRSVADQRLVFPRAVDKPAVIPEGVKLAVLETVSHLCEGALEGMKRLQAEGATGAAVLGGSSSFASDASLLPAGARRELDKLFGGAGGWGAFNAPPSCETFTG